MKTRWLQKTRRVFLAALGLAVFLGNPALAQADQGKWWTPKQGGRGHAYSRPWQGGPVCRDVVMIRRGPRGHYFRARRVYVEPYYNRHIVYVRPVRFYLSADAHIGLLDIHVEPYGNDEVLYGCNFCDARFGTYGGYSTHLFHCDARPDGYEVCARDR